MQARVVILGAGFGGLELATMLSNEFGDGIDVTLVDRSPAFSFGFAKLDVMFGRSARDAVLHPYRDIAKPGVRFLQAAVTAIDPQSRRVTTEDGVLDADYLVIALGADYDVAATPGLAEGGNEFYTLGGAERLAGLIDGFSSGRALIGVCGTPFKCPPAPTEAALLLHDHLVARGCRDACEIAFVIPFDVPIPPSPETSRALVAAFAERGIEFIPGRRITALDAARSVTVLDDGTELAYDLFLGVPRHRVPDVVANAMALAEDGYVAVSAATMETQVPRVYAIGDCTSVGVPKAGVFAEGEARVAAASLIDAIRGVDEPHAYDGRGSCYIEFGAGRVGRVDVDFFSGPRPVGTYHEPSTALVAEKHDFGASRLARWFGGQP
ncbi:MAG TPA: FAD-dependent oxidoreductase [Candidatus Angelobacter sp.]|nr:FAD-dependent oxidoreductase [Candidatus Angelobacter sp.]